MQIAKTYSEEIVCLASRTLSENRVAVFIVAYNAEGHIETVLERIPDWVSEKLTEVFIIDDSSKDGTLNKAVSAIWTNVHVPLRVFRTPYNQGYGGNQILGYSYAIAQKFDIVLLLHGDGQYAPEFLPEILAEYSRPLRADAVYGSRFMTKWGALKGGMPLYKFFGNRALTWIQNKIVGTRMSEMHSGYRSYRTSALMKVPFRANSHGFDFDSDIIIQFTAAGLAIREVPIPTFYGNEICNVDGLRYAWACVKGAFQYRLMRLEIFYDVKFDVSKRQRNYTIKESPTSLHYHMRKLPLPPGSELLDIGGGDGSAVGLSHADRGVNTTVVDQRVSADDQESRRAAGHPHLHLIAADLDADWTIAVGSRRFNTVFALDVLEHLKSPERAASQLFSVMEPGGKLYASTGNVSYWIIRGIHVLGHFNYGRRGILDLTHTRLFTVKSFKRLLRDAGFRIDSVRCFGPPIADLADDRKGILCLIDRISALLAKYWNGLFGYQILIEATRSDSAETLIARTFLDQRESQIQSCTVSNSPIPAAHQ
jgi:glycosyltransferase involved in cell wall biosynthesis